MGWIECHGGDHSKQSNWIFLGRKTGHFWLFSRQFPATASRNFRVLGASGCFGGNECFGIVGNDRRVATCSNHLISYHLSPQIFVVEVGAWLVANGCKLGGDLNSSLQWFHMDFNQTYFLKNLALSKVKTDQNRCIWILSGWWFGFFLFSHLLGIIIPIDFHIFQRGGPTTNQLWICENHMAVYGGFTWRLDFYMVGSKRFSWLVNKFSTWFPQKKSCEKTSRGDGWTSVWVHTLKKKNPKKYVTKMVGGVFLCYFSLISHLKEI